MGKQMNHIDEQIQEFILAQKVFFVGTAMQEGKINVSPKGLDSFRVVNPNRIVWLNLTGSGNETAAHLLESNRMTIMFCAFEGKPLILRLYGKAVAYHEREEKFKEYTELFPKMLGTRQFIEMDIELVQTSCGYGVPMMEYKEKRPQMEAWAERKGIEGIKEYWKEKNTVSLDGHETQILE